MAPKKTKIKPKKKATPSKPLHKKQSKKVTAKKVFEKKSQKGKPVKSNHKSQIPNSTRPISKKIAEKPPAPFVALTVIQESPALSSPALSSPAMPPLASQSPPTPTREPVRKIFSNGRVLRVLEKPVPNRTLAVKTIEEALEAPSETQIAELKPLMKEASNISIANKEAAPMPKQANPELGIKRAWNDLPASIPTRISFLLKIMSEECEQASSWPFSFAKLIASLPQEICGLNFALLVLSMDLKIEDLSKQLGIGSLEIELRLANASSLITEKFSKLCPDMYRKTSTQLGGAGKSIKALFEPYLIAKVDPQFQYVIGEVLLGALKNQAAVDGQRQESWVQAKAAN